jgi:hypothetical protein
MPRGRCARSWAESPDLRPPPPARGAILAAPSFEETAVSHSPFAGAVVYAKDIVRVSRFYAQVAGFEIVHEVADHVVLESADCELVVVAIPAAIAVNIHIATPPARRENTAVKLVFRVDDLDAARIAMRAAGGGRRAQPAGPRVAVPGRAGVRRPRSRRQRHPAARRGRLRRRPGFSRPPS